MRPVTLLWVSDPARLVRVGAGASSDVLSLWIVVFSMQEDGNFERQFVLLPWKYFSCSFRPRCVDAVCMMRPVSRARGACEVVIEDVVTLNDERPNYDVRRHLFVT